MQGKVSKSEIIYDPDEQKSTASPAAPDGKFRHYWDNPCASRTVGQSMPGLPRWLRSLSHASLHYTDTNAVHAHLPQIHTTHWRDKLPSSMGQARELEP